MTIIETKGLSVALALTIFAIGTWISFLVWCVFAELVIASYVLGASVGFFFLGLIPLMMRISIDYNKRLIETLPSGFIFFLSQAFALIYSYPIIDADYMGIHSLWMILLIYSLSIIVLLVVVIRISKEQKSSTMSLVDPKYVQD